MSPHNPFDDPKLITELAHAFESIWLVMRAHDPFLMRIEPTTLVSRSVGSSSSLLLLV